MVSLYVPEHRPEWSRSCNLEVRGITLQLTGLPFSPAPPLLHRTRMLPAASLVASSSCHGSCLASMNSDGHATCSVPVLEHRSAAQFENCFMLAASLRFSYLFPPLLVVRRAGACGPGRLHAGGAVCGHGHRQHGAPAPAPCRRRQRQQRRPGVHDAGQRSHSRVHNRAYPPMMQVDLGRSRVQAHSRLL